MQAEPDAFFQKGGKLNQLLAWIWEPINFIISRRRLILVMTRRTIAQPFAGQAVGGLWAFIHPFFLMLLYSIVFSFLIDARFGNTPDLPLDYTIFLLSGLVPWLSFMTVLSAAGMEITSNTSLVKQVVFPLEVLPIKATFAALVPEVVGLTFIVGYSLFKRMKPYFGNML